jgi:hypothetical protein
VLAKFCLIASTPIFLSTGPRINACCYHQFQQYYRTLLQKKRLPAIFFVPAILLKADVNAQQVLI